MMIKQLSLFVENRPGALSAVCQVLKNNRINIRTLSLADTQQFGRAGCLSAPQSQPRKRSKPPVWWSKSPTCWR